MNSIKSKLNTKMLNWSNYYYIVDIVETWEKIIEEKYNDFTKTFIDEQVNVVNVSWNSSVMKIDYVNHLGNIVSIDVNIIKWFNFLEGIADDIE